MIRNNEYEKFLNEYIPKSNLLHNNNANIIYLRVIENLIVTDIFRNYISEYKVECYIEFLDDYKIQYTKMLLYVGINDYEAVTYCIRGLIESLLKFIYSIYIVEQKENIQKLSFRNIKEDLKEFNRNGLNMNIELIIKLCEIYGKYSNAIHGKIDNRPSLQYIAEIIESENRELRNVEDILLDILNIYEDIMIEILAIESLATSELIVLKKSINNNRYSKLIQKITNKKE